MWATIGGASGKGRRRCDEQPLNQPDEGREQRHARGQRDKRAVTAASVHQPPRYVRRQASPALIAIGHSLWGLLCHLPCLPTPSSPLAVFVRRRRAMRSLAA
jgi:hypothetical protein